VLVLSGCMTVKRILNPLCRKTTISIGIERGGVTLFSPATNIIAKVFRFDPSNEKEGYLQSFTIKTSEPLSVMTILAKIHDLDPTFACRTSTCFKGQCGSCLIRVNGKNVLGCVELVHPGEEVILEPHSNFRIIRDVAVDFSQPLSTHQKNDEEKDQ